MSARRSESVANKSVLEVRWVVRGSSLTGGPRRPDSRPTRRTPRRSALHGAGPDDRTSRTTATGRRVRRGRPRRRGRRTSAPARGLLHVEHVDRLRAERVDVGRAHGDVEPRPGPRRPGGRRRAGRRCAPRGRSPARDASGRTTTGARSATGVAARAGRPGRPGPSTIASKPLPQHRLVEVLLGDLPHRDADVVLRPGPGGAHRGPLQGEHRGGVGEQARPGRGASTVTRAPSVDGLDARSRPPPRRTSLGTATSPRRPSAARAGSPSSGRGPARRARGPARPATSTRPSARWPGRRPR